MNNLNKQNIKNSRNILPRMTFAICLFVVFSMLAVNLVLVIVAESGSEDTTASVEKLYTLTTNSNPDYYAKFTINNGVINVEGCFKDDLITSIKIRKSGTVSVTLKGSENGKFTAVVNPLTGYNVDEIVLYLTSGVSLSYRIEYNDGWYFPDNGLSVTNDAKLDNIILTPEMAWANYISADLDKQEVIDTLEQIQSISDEAVKGATTDYEKAKLLSKWVSDNIYYDYDASTTSVSMKTIALYNVLATKRTVCGGFANLYAALLEAQGIDSINLKGSTVAGTVTFDKLMTGVENHEWTAVNLDGKWVYVDSCWDSGNRYQNGEFTKQPSYLKYFDPDGVALSLNHRVDKAEKRHYFRAPEYFEKLEQTGTTVDETATTTTTNTTSTTSTTSDTIAETTKETQATQVTSTTAETTSQNQPQAEDDGIMPLLIGAIIVLAGCATGLVIYLIKNKNK